MKKRIIIIAIAALFILPCFAEDILLVDVQGKVEIKQPGRSWTPAEKGSALSMKTQISTGFNSKAVLDIGEARTTIQPLTRLEIQDVEIGGTEQKTALFLGSGRVRAEVKKSRDIRVNFSITTPVATAAVRGTQFRLSSWRLMVEDGTVEFGSGGYRHFVKKGGSSSFSEGVLGNPLTDPYDEIGGGGLSGDLTDYTSIRRSRGAAGSHTGQPIITIY